MSAPGYIVSHRLHTLFDLGISVYNFITIRYAWPPIRLIELIPRHWWGIPYISDNTVLLFWIFENTCVWNSCRFLRMKPNYFLFGHRRHVAHVTSGSAGFFPFISCLLSVYFHWRIHKTTTSIDESWTLENASDRLLFFRLTLMGSNGVGSVRRRSTRTPWRTRSCSPTRNAYRRISSACGAACTETPSSARPRGSPARRNSGYSGTATSPPTWACSSPMI